MIELKQIDGGMITPKDDALLYDFWLSGQSGVFEGCVVTHLGANQLHIAPGRGVICGRVFVVTEETILAQLAETGTQNGRLLVRVDLANNEAPVALVTQAASALPELVQEDINRAGSVYELPLSTYTVTETQVDNLTSVVRTVASMEQALKSAPTKSSLVNNDQVIIADSAANSSTKRVTWSAVKAAIKSALADIGAAPTQHTHTSTEVSYTNPAMPGVGNAKQGLDALQTNKMNITQAYTSGSVDLNDFIDTGFFTFSSGVVVANIPIGVNGYLLVIKGWSPSTVKQIWWRHGTNDVNDHQMFVRTFNGVPVGWSSWVQFATTDLAGVNLDAITVGNTKAITGALTVSTSAPSGVLGAGKLWGRY